MIGVSHNGQPASQPGATADERMEIQWLKDRLARQERGIVMLRDVLKEEVTLRESAVSERDCMIGELQAAVGQRDQAIRDLQAQILQRDLRIRDLEVEGHRLHLQGQIGDRDMQIRELQAQLQNIRLSGELHLKAAASAARIADLEAQVNERDRQVQAMQAELHSIHLSKLWPLVRLSGTIRHYTQSFRLFG